MRQVRSRSQQILPATPSESSPVNPKLWLACAGASVRIPELNSRVYYFPQGHLEHASSSPQNHNPLAFCKIVVLCRVSAVQLLADPDTDEVFSKILLRPIPTNHHNLHHRTTNSVEAPPADDDIVSVTKVLTTSDANLGGGFSVPKQCADLIFPPLDLRSDRPEQTLFVTDFHGKVWEFRHIYRGKPKRHLLSTGWSKFVNSKRLIGGDSLVFMKDSAGNVFVGIRRVVKYTSGNRIDYATRCAQICGREINPERQQQIEEIPRKGRGKLLAKQVAEAAELAAQNLPFEIMYYPRVGLSDFVVKAEIVENALNVQWTPGMRLRMAVEPEISFRMTFFRGIVSSVCASDSGFSQGSPWRMLQVIWDEPEGLRNFNRVNPWEVELLPPPSPALPPSKRFRTAYFPGVPNNIEGEFTVTGFSNSTMGWDQPLLSENTFPAGMQGARHDLCLPTTSNAENDHFPLGIPYYLGNMVSTTSTDRNMDSSRSSTLSPDNQSSLQLSSVTQNSINSTKLGGGGGSIQLFGKTIQLE